MRPSLRKFVLAVHLTVSVGWIGAVAAYIPFDISTVTSRDPATLRSAYLAMESIAGSVIVPLALASLVTGIAVSLGTVWGLFRHYWVLISLVMTTLATVVLLLETRTITALAEMAADPGTSAERLRAMPSTLAHSVGGTLILLVVLFLNIYKPRGLTRYGWRKEQERRSGRRRELQQEPEPSRPWADAKAPHRSPKSRPDGRDPPSAAPRGPVPGTARPDPITD